MTDTKVWFLEQAAGAVRVEVTADAAGAVLRVEAGTGGEWLTVAQAKPCRDLVGCWQVAALLAGHEELVDAAAVCQWLLEDLHEIFSGRRLVPVAGWPVAA